jgi:PBP1b-binding outer membrane lipoprotein LpoB
MSKYATVALLIVMLSGCAGVTRPKAFRVNSSDRCFIQVKQGDYLKVEEVGEEWCDYDKVPRKFQKN